MSLRRAHFVDVVLIAAITVSLQAVVFAEKQAAPVIADSPTNKAWHSSADAREHVLVDAADPAVLELQKAAFAARPIRIQIETDGSNCALSSGKSEIKIQLSPDAVTDIVIDTNPENPLLRINGEATAKNRGKWIDIAARQTDQILRLRIENATYATIKIEHESAPARKNAAGRNLRNEKVEKSGSTSGNVPAPKERRTSGRRASDPDESRAVNPSPQKAAPDQSSLERAKQCVFQVKIFDADGQLIAGGTGFLAAAGGFGITNAHVVDGASSAVAVFAGEAKEYPLQLWDIRRELDLALVRVEADEKELSARGIIIPSDRAASEGEDVWALGFPLSLGYSVTKGVVNGVRRSSELPESVRPLVAGVKSLVQTDCTINPGNSGGPLINREGALVGINTWVFVKGQNVYFAIDRSEIAVLLTNLSPKPITFAAIAGSEDSNAISWRAFATGVPRIKIASTGTADALNASTSALEGILVQECRSCGGDGKVTVRVTTGYRNDGGLRRPIQRNSPRRCKRCAGKGKVDAKPEAALRIATRFCSSLATLKSSDPKAKEALDRAYVAITQDLRDSPVAKGVLNEHAMGQLAHKSIKTGQPMLVSAFYLFGVLDEEKQERVHYLLMEDSEQLLIVLDPRLADEVAGTGVHVFMGGLIGGTIKLSDGARVVVIQNGFLVKSARPAAVKRNTVGSGF